jgi:phage regulator Rha-like protein
LGHVNPYAKGGKMNALALTQNDSPLTMSSREIAELVESRHDNVRVAIERLVGRGVINQPETRMDTILPAMQVNPIGAGRPSKTYFLNKRDSLVVVAQLSPEFTARVIDRWQELEDQVKQPSFDPANLTRLQLLELAIQAEQERLVLEAKVQEQEPTVQAMKRLEASQGSLCITDVAKILSMQPKQLFVKLHTHRWIFRRGGYLTGYADKVQDGLIEVNPLLIKRGDGTSKIGESVRVTPKGLAKLSRMFPRSPSTGDLFGFGTPH